LNGTTRAGILTHASLLAIYSHDTDTSPTQRGKFIRNRLLCEVVAPPPPGVTTTAPPPKPGTSTRQNFAAHISNPQCAGCHNAMDPIGFGFEGFDAAGKARGEDGGQPVDTSGKIMGSQDADGEFSGPNELAEK